MSCTSRQITAPAGLASAVLLIALGASGCGFHRKPYENPITKDTQQPDKVLYDKAIKDIEHGRYEVARLTLNTLINTYDSSEFLAKAKLAIADSWYREGSMQGRAQAEAEYKDFILFYPTMEEAAESQEKICAIHYEEMDKADRDPNNALRAEQECRQLLVQFPNSKFAPVAEQRLRNIQEVLGEAEMVAGAFYHHKGSHAAASNRFTGLVEQYPLYSKSDEALWLEADSYTHMGPRFRQKAGDAYAKIVRDYPLSPYAGQAKKKLEEMELPIPEADPAAVARMRFEAENHTKPGMLARTASLVSHAPDVSAAAKSGTPTMTNPKAEIPASVPVPAGTSGFSGDVTVAPVGDSTALDTKPDARSGVVGAAAAPAPGAATAAGPGANGTAGATTPAAANQSSPAAAASAAAQTTNASAKNATPAADPKSKKKKDKKKKSDQSATQTAPAATPASPSK